MKKLNCKLIVSDFDGTLITDKGQILPEVKAAINQYVADGGIFAVCTGRMIRSILPRVRDIGLKGLVIGCQGTVIADIETGELIKNGGMPVEEVAEICRNIEELNHHINIYCGDEMYANLPKDDVSLQEYERVTGIDVIHVEGNISDFVLKNNLTCQKVSILVDPKEKTALYEELDRRLGTKYDVTCSAHVLVEVSPITDNKGEALKFLSNHYNIPIEKCVAVGDQLNDFSMVKAAGVGVAVGNATQKLKDAANFIAVTNNEGAVAQVIEKFGYLN